MSLCDTTRKYTQKYPNKHAKQEWCEAHRKYWKKLLKTWTMIYLGSQNDPENWASEANIQHASKSSSNWHVHEDWCETSGKFFEKMTKDRNFYLFWSPKWSQNWSSDAQILHTSKSTRNEAIVTPYQWKFLRKWPNTRILTYFGAPKGPEIGPQNIVHISESSFDEHIKQDWCESRVSDIGFITEHGLNEGHIVNPEEAFYKYIRKLEFWVIWRPKNLAFGAYLLHNTKNISSELVSEVSSESGRSK